MKGKRITALLLSMLLALQIPAAVLAAPIPKNKIRSELTNEWIDRSLKNQRPVAVLVDNESIALDQFGINQADIVYELMNSTKNNRITRLMAIQKDWAGIRQLGNIRSARPSNFVLAAEYNAIVLHDGGPIYIQEYLDRPYTDHLSAGFARFPNGKASEFTEYITAKSYTNPSTGRTYAGLLDRIAKENIGTSYNEYYSGPVFTFSDAEVDLSGYSDAQPAAEAALPFPHNNTLLTYNQETGTYDYSEYGKQVVDGLDKSVTTYKNVIIQNCDYSYLDDGYMLYDLVNGTVHNGYYLTDGTAVPITWEKTKESLPTVYRNAETGEEITLNTGRTYIAMVPSDVWDSLEIR